MKVKFKFFSSDCKLSINSGTIFNLEKLLEEKKVNSLLLNNEKTKLSSTKVK
ncbi:hypothetical protein [Mycoplasma parvum]|uniref:Uncharacterized protein n=1 Tax=Mycoplasma parvum str. Indiana TaxID=1403316 RepID=U5NG67_9MOLU|nr:hypothetical protein [Mycoplasma parvum]AGX89263.1 hypothetical protein PRV_02665 [Mycoplasma parvum str. Indiana]